MIASTFASPFVLCNISPEGYCSRHFFTIVLLEAWRPPLMSRSQKHKWISFHRMRSPTDRRTYHGSTNASKDPSQCASTSATGSLHLCLCDILLAVMTDGRSYRQTVVIICDRLHSGLRALLSRFITTARNRSRISVKRDTNATSLLLVTYLHEWKIITLCYKDRPMFYFLFYLIIRFLYNDNRRKYVVIKPGNTVRSHILHVRDIEQQTTYGVSFLLLSE